MQLYQAAWLIGGAGKMGQMQKCPEYTRQLRGRMQTNHWWLQSSKSLHKKNKDFWASKIFIKLSLIKAFHLFCLKWTFPSLQGFATPRYAEYSATYHFSTCELLSWLLMGWLEPDGS